jgi:DNA-binding response OmpR family regulator
VIRLVETMMSLEAEKRFQTPNHLLDTLKRVRIDLAGGGEAAGGKKPQPTIFVVENDDRLQDAIREKLKEHGYRVLIARDPARALERFHSQPFDGLIIDAGTTGAEGAKVYKEILERARLKDVACGCIAILSEGQNDLPINIPTSKSAVILRRPLKLKQLMKQVRALVPVEPQAANAAAASSPVE